MSSQSGSSEVSKKLKAAIRAKLEELGVYVDEELPEYIMVMIANKKDKAHMKDDLNLFIGKSTGKFVDWLFDLFERLQSASSKTAAEKTNAKAEKEAQEEKERKERIEKEKKEKEQQRKIEERERQEKEREREREKEKIRAEKARKEKEREEQERERERVKREETRARREKAATRSHRNRRSRSRTWSDDDIGQTIQHQHEPRNYREEPPKKVASAVVVRQIPKSPEPHKVQSKVVVKRNIRPSGEADTTVKARGSMFMRALNAASVSTGYGAPSAVRHVAESSPKKQVEVQRQNVQRKRTKQEEVEQYSSDEEYISQTKQPRTLQGRLTNRRIEPDVHSANDYDSDTIICDRECTSDGPKIVVTLKGAQDPPRKNRSVVMGDTSKKRKPVQNAEISEEIQEKEEVDAKKSKHERIKFDLETPPRPAEASDSPTLRKWDGQIQLEEDTSDEEAEIDAVLAATRKVHSTEDEETLPPTHQLSGHPTFSFQVSTAEYQQAPAYVPTPLSVLQQQNSAVAPSTHFHGSTSMEDNRSSERCRFWPSCTKGDTCQYHHPSVPCKAFPNCSYNARCLFIHPPCRFDKKCNKAGCPYTHYGRDPTPAVNFPPVAKIPKHVPVSTLSNNSSLSALAAKLAAIPKALNNKIIPKEVKVEVKEVKTEPSSVANEEGENKQLPKQAPASASSSSDSVPHLNSFTPCRFGAGCRNPICNFKHPKECRFGDNCTNPACFFYHKPTAKPTVPINETAKFKWKAPT